MIEPKNTIESGAQESAFDNGAAETSLPDKNREEIRRMGQFGLLANMRRSLTDILDPEAVTQEILKEMQDFIPGVVGRLWITDEDGKSRHVAGSIGLVEDASIRPAEGGLASLAIADRKLKISLDIASDPRFVKKAFAKEEGLVSCIMLPLIHQDRCYGNLSLYTRQRHEFSAEEIESLREQRVV